MDFSENRRAANEQRAGQSEQEDGECVRAHAGGLQQGPGEPVPDRTCPVRGGRARLPGHADRLVEEYSELVRSVVAEAAPQAEAVVET